MSKEEQVYQLAKEIFLKRAPGEFINDKSKPGYEAQAANAIKMAQFFVEYYEQTVNNRK
jgi:hypothetical protein